MVTLPPPDTQKYILMHFWMNWVIFDDFQFKCLNFIFFKILKNPGGGARYPTNQISLALTPLPLTMWCCVVPVLFICYSNTIGCYHLIIRLTFRITINLIRKICFMLLDINEQNKNFQNLLCWTKVIKAQIFELFVPCPYSNIYRVFSRNWYKVFTNCSG